KDSTIVGRNAITYKVTNQARDMQIDLQKPLHVDSVNQDGQSLNYHRDGSAYFITMKAKQPVGAEKKIIIYYSGHPHVAKRPPWQGGFTWDKDKKGRPWIETTSQGVGASVWWPNKDQWKDEPDSMSIHATVPDPLIDVSNGRLRKKTHHSNGTTTYYWHVSNPINNYDASLVIGNFKHFHGLYHGAKGKLVLDYWVLDYNLKKAKSYFPPQVHKMLKCFEYWFGPYAFYKDSYKLVDVPSTGMEDQSNITYGNKYAYGYRGRDESGTGYGKKFDFIIVHESSHQWWGNNVTASDIADMWIHESFANLAEALYVECQFGKKEGEAYTRGERKNIKNKRPIIGHYGVHDEGSEDMYYKGSNMLLTIREIINNDSTFRHILRGIQKKFYHQTVTTQQIKDYFIAQSGKNLDDVFDEYLHETSIPIFKYYIRNNRLHYQWKAAIDYFNMPLKVHINSNQKWTFIKPTTDRWQTVRLHLNSPGDFKVNKNFYIKKDSLTSVPPVRE
ncbi:MAG TPA: M1 family metallopeptidase, partial [Balneolaceae bacterium]|nr:M1 family metallopeptidase [Balneolaceae bacterium]